MKNENATHVTLRFVGSKKTRGFLCPRNYYQCLRKGAKTYQSSLCGYLKVVLMNGLARLLKIVENEFPIEEKLEIHYQRWCRDYSIENKNTKPSFQKYMEWFLGDYFRR